LLAVLKAAVGNLDKRSTNRKAFSLVNGAPNFLNPTALLTGHLSYLSNSSASGASKPAGRESRYSGTVVAAP
jgi:hypothetical protein